MHKILENLLNFFLGYRPTFVDCQGASKRQLQVKYESIIQQKEKERNEKNQRGWGDKQPCQREGILLETYP